MGTIFVEMLVPTIRPGKEVGGKEEGDEEKRDKEEGGGEGWKHLEYKTSKTALSKFPNRKFLILLYISRYKGGKCSLKSYAIIWDFSQS